MTYQKFVERQHLFQLAINTNDFDLRLKCWKESLPLCFSTNKQNYARYGTYYCRQLQSIEIKYPGAKDELLKKGLSVCRNSMNIGQSIDGAGEQTFMRSSKTAGGIKDFTHRKETYEKWVLNRPFQAKMVESLLSLADLDNFSSDPRKCLREREIRKSEERVTKLMQVMKEDFINPFDANIDQQKLFNLASGRPLSEEASSSLFSAEERCNVGPSWVSVPCQYVLIHNFDLLSCNYIV
ncbi:uncharacterized protein LOC135691081 [Rhopilema esculentum]|uniref:uncharacterized protein LOC135691081 n=1 Tax=Rhopilema esculentum TaxID=499914 RepID=UPI0031CE6F57